MREQVHAALSYLVVGTGYRSPRKLIQSPTLVITTVSLSLCSIHLTLHAGVGFTVNLSGFGCFFPLYMQIKICSNLCLTVYWLWFMDDFIYIPFHSVRF